MKKTNEGMLFHTVKFEIVPTYEQGIALLWIGNLLRELWNGALEERQRAVRAIKRLRELAEARGELGENLPRPPNFFNQSKSLTVIRGEDPLYAAVSRSAEEETLNVLDGSFKSFFALRKGGDTTARPPRYRSSDWFFTIALRASGYRFKSESIILTCNLPGVPALEWSMPPYVSGKLEGKRVKAIKVYRDPSRLDQPGHCWVSISYEFPAPESRCVEWGNTAFVAMGTSSVGVYAPSVDILREFKQWRPERYWVPRIAAVQSKRDKCRKYSRRWRSYNAVKRKMERKMSGQLTQHQRETALRLLDCGDLLVIGVPEVRLGLAQTESGSTALHREVQNTGALSRLIQQVNQKAKEQGKKVVLIERFAPAHVCSQCGKEHPLQQGERRPETFSCSCGHCVPWRLNAAQNVSNAFSEMWET